MTASAGSSTSIMVVEDEPVVALNLRRSLEKLGYAVAAVAQSGRKAIRLAEQLRPDLILMDIRLKGAIDGIEAAFQIGLQSRTPVVFMTAHTDDETIARAKATRPCGFLTKPYGNADLKTAISLAMEEHRFRCEARAGRSLLATVLENVHDAVIATDVEGRVRYMNTRAERLTGWHFDQADGKPITEIYLVTMMAGSAAAGSAAGRMRLRLRSRAGVVTPIEETVSPVLARDQGCDVVTVFRDIRERLLKEARENKEKDRLGEEILAASAALGQTRAKLLALSGRLIDAQERERRCIAVELHDNLGQLAALIDVEARQLGSQMPANGGPARHLLNSIRMHTEALRSAIWKMAYDLDPSLLADLGVTAVLRSLVEDFERIGLSVEIRIRGVAEEMNPEATMAFYRIAQDAMSNALRLAPGARIRITLSQTPKETLMVVENHWPGFDLSEVGEKDGLGLITMSERARMAGGTLLLRTDPGKGMIIVFRVPFAPCRDL